MPAATTNKFRLVANAWSGNLISPISNTDTSASPNSTVGLPTTTAVTIVIDRVDSSGNKTPQKREYCMGVVSGSQLISLVRGLNGSIAQPHLSGAVIEIVWDAATWNDAVNALLVQHNQDGTHADITATSVTSSGNVSSPNITNITNAVGLNTNSFVGAVWTAGSGTTASMSVGTLWIGSTPSTLAAISSNSFVDNADNYVDFDSAGNPHYSHVGNGVASPALTSGYTRHAKVVVTGGVIVSITQYGFDSLGNYIYNTNPNPSVILETPLLNSVGVANGVYTALTNSMTFVAPRGGLAYLEFEIGRVTNTSGSDLESSLQVLLDGTQVSIMNGPWTRNGSSAGFHGSGVFPVTSGTHTFQLLMAGAGGGLTVNNALNGGLGMSLRMG